LLFPDSSFLTVVRTSIVNFPSLPSQAYHAIWLPFYMAPTPPTGTVFYRAKSFYPHEYLLSLNSCQWLSFLNFQLAPRSLFLAVLGSQSTLGLFVWKSPAFLIDAYPSRFLPSAAFLPETIFSGKGRNFRTTRGTVYRLFSSHGGLSLTLPPSSAPILPTEPHSFFHDRQTFGNSPSLMLLLM